MGTLRTMGPTIMSVSNTWITGGAGGTTWIIDKAGGDEIIFEDGDARQCGDKSGICIRQGYGLIGDGKC